MKILVLGPAEMVAAFALGGMSGEAVHDRAELRSVLDRLQNRAETGILVIEEGVAELDRNGIDQLKLDPRAPLIVEVPGLFGPSPGRQTPLDVVRRALGISI